jgi:MFS family permease
MMGPIYFATAYAYRVALVEDALQGRVNSVYRLLAQAGLALGSGVGGALLLISSVRTELWLIAVGFGLCVALIGLTGLHAISQHPLSEEAVR